MAATSAKHIAAAFDGRGKSWRRWPSHEPPPCDFYSSDSNCNVAPSLLRPGVRSGSGYGFDGGGWVSPVSGLGLLFGFPFWFCYHCS
uniref:Uncharacterized protein n=1 Tax=Ipomoea trifida TaxID=35884 RepID=A0A951_IPOTF|nr:hypothetical protein [Ipomoea trifida]